MRGNSVLRAMLRAVRRRDRLTAQERANLRASQPRPAIFTASLGAHAPLMTTWWS
jgi:hypothetical protein